MSTELRQTGTGRAEVETDRDHIVERLDVVACTIPTELPEGDGTLAWSETTIVIVEAHVSGGVTGVGFAYGDTAMVPLIREKLAKTVQGKDVRMTGECWSAMRDAIRNLGRPGISSMSIAAVDIALWDAAARCAGLPLFRYLGGVRDTVPVYGSGGFTTYDVPTLVRQMRGWVDAGIPRVKMKIAKDRGRSEREDLERISAVREAIGADVELFVDANGGYSRMQALRLGRTFVRDLDVRWFEEPVSSDDLDGLHQLRDSLDLDVTAGEYGYDLPYFRHMLDRRAVDVLQADIGRCAGLTEWLRVGALAQAYEVPYSGHCGPSIHAHAAAVPPNLRHLEYFHDHARIESMLFDGTLGAEGGELRLSHDRPGLGLTLKREEVERYRVA